MKKIIVLALILVMTASMCVAALAGEHPSSDHPKAAKAKDPVTATVEATSKVVTTPVEAVFGDRTQHEQKEMEKDR